MYVRLQGKPFNISIIQVYAPTIDADEEEMEKFYDQINSVKAQCKSQDIVIVMGDFNAKVGKCKRGKAIGLFGLGSSNDRRDSMAEWCEKNDRVILNTWFEHHPIRLWTCKSPGGNVRNQIDYILINSRFWNAGETM